MKSLNAIAKEMDISHQTVYKKIPPWLRNMCEETDKGKKLYNEEAERLIKEYFKNDMQPNAQHGAQREQSEIEYLRRRVETLEEDLRMANERFQQMAMKFAEIYKNDQILIGMEKRSIWKRIFGRR